MNLFFFQINKWILLFNEFIIFEIIIFFFFRSCIGFLKNWSVDLRIGHRARPRIADRGALYRGLLPNTHTKLNKQSRTMTQGFSRRNNPQAKVLTTVTRAAWHQGPIS